MCHFGSVLTLGDGGRRAEAALADAPGLNGCSEAVPASDSYHEVPDSIIIGKLRKLFA